MRKQLQHDCLFNLVLAVQGINVSHESCSPPPSIIFPKISLWEHNLMFNINAGVHDHEVFNITVMSARLCSNSSLGLENIRWI